jgi:hypothetical protein
VDPCGHEVERDDRKHGEEPLDERFAALPLRGSCSAVFDFSLAN